MLFVYAHVCRTITRQKKNPLTGVQNAHNCITGIQQTSPLIHVVHFEGVFDMRREIAKPIIHSSTLTIAEAKVCSARERV